MTQEPDRERTDKDEHTGKDRRTARGGRSVRGRAVVAGTTVAVLALGGTVAYAATSGAERSGGGSPAPTASSPGHGRGHGHGPAFGLGGAVHGEATVKDRDSGEWIVRVWQRGTVEKVDGDRVTVRSEDGASWTWTVGSGTPVLRDGGKSTGAGALEKDESVRVAGTRTGDTRTAERVVSGPFGDTPRDGDGHGGPGHRWGNGHRWGDDGPEASGEAT
ncbi:MULTISPECIES: hypothetical protein [unclassified Streptomyces]|uniref:hypothetical protein n=1 Tax=unclassified Streptomyces TaxID=2593676 RepID=UPI003D740E82